MKENIKYFETLNDANGYIINDIPFAGYIKENELVIFNNDPNKMLIILNWLVIVSEVVDIVFETLNDADGYIIETIPFSCYILENCQLLECNLENCKIVVEDNVAIIKEVNDIIKYTATSKVTPYDPSSLPTIISNDFDENTEKGVIKFAADVESIGSQSFYDCTGLTSITIPNSVTSIGDTAFASCTSLTMVTIPNSVVSIKFQAFYSCSSLTSIIIGNSVTNIGYLAFYDCSSLTSISYTGTISQYNSIAKGIDWHKNVLATVVHCTDGDTPI